MLVYEGLGYNRFGLRYVGAEEIAERRKHVLERNPVDFGKNPSGPYHEIPQEKHKKHLKKMEEERKEKVIRTQIISFSALAVAGMSAGLYHVITKNPTQATGDILCAATAFIAAVGMSVPAFIRQRD